MTASIGLAGGGVPMSTTRPEIVPGFEAAHPTVSIANSVSDKEGSLIR